MLAVLKIVATALCYGSGNAGGIFGPALFIGAMMGGGGGRRGARAVARRTRPRPARTRWWAWERRSPGLCARPLTSVIMIFEITRDYTIIVPLMISNLIAFFISYKLQKEPIYEALAHQDGVHLPSAGAEPALMRVVQAMRPPPEALPPEMDAATAAGRVLGESLDAWPVAGGKVFVGMVRKTELESAVARGEGGRKLAEILAGRSFPHLHPDHRLGLALERMGAAHVNVLPVISRANLRRVDRHRNAGRRPARLRCRGSCAPNGTVRWNRLKLPRAAPVHRFWARLRWYSSPSARCSPSTHSWPR